MPNLSKKWGYDSRKLENSTIDKYHMIWWSDGSTSGGGATSSPNPLEVMSSNRQYHTSNPPRLVDGTAWRSRSSYQFGGWEAKYTAARYSVERSGPGFRQKDEYYGVPKCWLWSWDFTPSNAFDPSYPAIIWSGELENRALASCYGKIRDGAAGWGENIAEARSTYDQLVSSGSRLIRAALAAKRRQWSSVRSILLDDRSIVHTASGTYLAYHFGWKPLMQDIHSTANLFRKSMQKGQFVTGRGSSGDGFSAPITKSATGWRCDGGSGSRQCRAALTGKTSSTFRRKADLMGVANPLSLAWELIPYSFVVDWFIPIGNSLQSLQDPAGLDFVDGFCTQRAKATWNGTWNNSDFQPSQGTPGHVSFDLFGMRRNAYGKWPIVGLYTTPSPFSSTSHAVTSLALLIQRCRS